MHGGPSIWTWRLAVLVFLLGTWQLWAMVGLCASEPVVTWHTECQPDPPVLCADPSPNAWTSGCDRNDTTTVPEDIWWTCTVARDCVRPPSFWLHQIVLAGWPARYRDEPAAFCGGKLTYLEALRGDWPAKLALHGPAAACADMGQALAEVLAAYDLNVGWGEAPVRPALLLERADRARLVLDDCCAGETFNVTDIHALTVDLYAYTSGQGEVPVCPDPYLGTDPSPDVPWADQYRAFMYADIPEGRLSPGGQIVTAILLGVAGFLLLLATTQSPFLQRRVRRTCCRCGRSNIRQI